MAARPRVDSYYAATAHPAPERPPLMGDRTTDVCVVGAGFTGLSVALNLAERGYEVVVLEAEGVGWGASGRNGGQIGSGFSADMEWLETWAGRGEARRLFALAEEAKAIIRERVLRHGIDCDLKWGSFQAASKPRHMKALAARMDRWAGTYEYGSLKLAETPADARAYVNSPVYIGGLADDGAGHLHPLNYCLGLARAAEAAGATIHEGTAVTGLDRTGAGGGRTGGGRARVRTAAGRVEADAVVLCGNAYLGDLVPDVRRVITPIVSHIVASRRFGPDLARQIIPSNAAIFDSHRLLSYYRLSPDHRLLFGGRVGGAALREADAGDALGARIRRLFPRIRDHGLEYVWSGKVALTRARMPHVGRLGTKVTFAQGYSGEGVAMSGLVGRVLAEAVAGQAERLDLFARLPHRAFPGGKRLQIPALALAVRWYRLLDALP